LIGLIMASALFAQKQVGSTSDFDFWIGEWNVYRNGTDQLAGESSITSDLDGNALLESYSAADGKYKGRSLNVYNAALDRWEQYYADNGGLVLHITGGMTNNSMVLTNTQLMNGKETENRISWTARKDGTVRQLWEQRAADQSEWTIAFDGIYTPKEP